LCLMRVAVIGGGADGGGLAAKVVIFEKSKSKLKIDFFRTFFSFRHA
jgi:hypothetical protein